MAAPAPSPTSNATPAPAARASAPTIAGLDSASPSFEDMVSAFLEDEKPKQPAPKEPGPDDAGDEEGEAAAAPDAAPEEAEEESEEAAAPAGKAKEAAAEEPTGPQMLAEIAKEFEVPEAEFLETIHLADATGQALPLKRIVEEWRSVPARIEQGLAQGRQELATAQQRYEGEANQRLQRLAALTQELQAVAALDAEPNWGELEASDPETYARERVRWTKRGEALERVRKTFREEMEHGAQVDQRQLQAFAQTQTRTLLEKRPEWREPQHFQKALHQIDGYLRREGFLTEELDRPLDARMIEIAYKASEYDRLRSKATGAEGKRLRRLPRLVSPTARRDEGAKGARISRIEKKKNVLRKTGSEAAAAALFEEFV